MIQNQKMARWVCSKSFLLKEFDPELDSGFFLDFKLQTSNFKPFQCRAIIP